jgi:hypothetical protein
MNEYGTFLVLFVFIAVVYIGTILWTEVWFPEKNVQLPPDEDMEALLLVKVKQVLAAARMREKERDRKEHEKEQTKLQFAGRGG